MDRTCCMLVLVVFMLYYLAVCDVVNRHSQCQTVPACVTHANIGGYIVYHSTQGWVVVEGGNFDVLGD